jgi:cell division septal protein FtsQ
MTYQEDDEFKSEKLKKESERAITRLILLGAIVLLLIVIIIGFLIRNSLSYK